MNNTLASKLTKLREQKGLKKNQVAEAVGVHPSSIGNLEKGSIPQADLLYSLSKLFNVSMEYLIDPSMEYDSQPKDMLSSDELHLLNLYTSLPPDAQKTALEFIEYLSYKHSNNESEKGEIYTNSQSNKIDSIIA